MSRDPRPFDRDAPAYGAEGDRTRPDRWSRDHDAAYRGAGDDTPRHREPRHQDPAHHEPRHHEPPYQDPGHHDAGYRGQAYTDAPYPDPRRPAPRHLDPRGEDARRPAASDETTRRLAGPGRAPTGRGGRAGWPPTGPGGDAGWTPTAPAGGGTPTRAGGGWGDNGWGTGGGWEGQRPPGGGPGGREGQPQPPGRAGDPGGWGWPSGYPRYDPEATMMLPVVPADATAVLPAYQPARAAGPGLAPAAGGLEADGDDEGRSVARNSATMAAGSIVSRVTGFLRTAVLAAALGALAVANGYQLADTVPNQVYEFLVGGVLSSVIVPVLVRARRRDPDGGEAYAQRLLTLAAVFLAGATVIAVACAPLIGLIYRNPDTTPAGQHLISVFGYLLLPEIFFYGMAALIAAVLNTRGHFAAPAWTPILNNIVVIATAVVFMVLPTATRPPTPENISTLQIMVLGVGTTLGIAVQAAGLLPALHRVGFRWKARWDWRQLHLGELARISAWMLVYVISSQIALVIVLWISNRAGSHSTKDHLVPGPQIFNTAYLIFMMANGIVAVSIMTALMPRMSAAAADRRWSDLTRQLSLGTRLSAVLLIPISVAYIVLGRQIAVTLFGWRDYSGKPAVLTGWVIAAAGVALVPFAISQLQLFTFYAMPDTKTPALLNIPVSALRILVDLVFLVVLPVVWVNAGLMLGNAISYVLAVGVGYWLLRRRIGRIDLTEVMGSLGRLAAAAVIAAVPTLLVALITQHYFGLSKVGSVIGLLVGGIVLIGVYLAAATALRVREINQVWAMVRSRLRR